MDSAANSRPRAYRSATRRQQAGQTRARIIGAARDLFADTGFEAASIAEIARRPGVSSQSVYAIFGSKPALLRELLTALEYDACVATWRQRIEAADGLAEQLRTFAGWTTSLYRTGFGVVRAAYQAGGDITALHREGDHRRRDALEGIIVRHPDRVRPGRTVDRAEELHWSSRKPTPPSVVRWSPPQS
jgi:AcrR family transcriptional regulator